MKKHFYSLRDFLALLVLLTGLYTLLRTLSLDVTGQKRIVVASSPPPETSVSQTETRESPPQGNGTQIKKAKTTGTKTTEQCLTIKRKKYPFVLQFELFNRWNRLGDSEKTKL